MILFAIVLSAVESLSSNAINVSQTLLIPYITEECREYGTYYNGLLQIQYVGTKKADIGEILEIKTSKVLISSNTEVTEVDTIELVLQSNPKGILYKFGSNAIQEIMAFTIERHIYPEVIDNPKDFCYVAAHRLIEFYYPPYNDPLNLIALCNASLKYFNPGVIFYRTLVKMKEINYIPTTPYKVYVFVFENFEFEFWGITRIDQIFNNHTMTNLLNSKGYLTHDIWAANEEWIKYTLIKANEFKITTGTSFWN